MLKEKVNKYYNGFLSVRDYVCKKAIKKGGLQIIHKNKIALEITPEQLQNALETNRNVICKSKFPPYKEYSLVDFRYKKEKETGQQTLL